MSTVKVSAKYFGYYSLISAVVFGILFIVDIIFALQTTWNCTDNSISDLGTMGIRDGAVPGFLTPGSGDPNYGNSPYYELTRALFTALVTIGGVAVAIYGIGVTVFEKGYAKIAGHIFILTGTLLALIGSFNRLYGDLHFFVSILMCITMIVGIAFLTYQEIREGIYFPCIAIAVCTLFSAVCWILEPMGIVPFGLAEIITFFIVIVWLVLQGVKILRCLQCVNDEFVFGVTQ